MMNEIIIAALMIIAVGLIYWYLPIYLLNYINSVKQKTIRPSRRFVAILQRLTAFL